MASTREKLTRIRKATEKRAVPIVDRKTADAVREAAERDLPPRGYKRDEELARRQDNLDQARQQLQDDPEHEHYNIENAKALTERDREISDKLSQDPTTGVYDYVILGLDWANFHYTCVPNRYPSHDPERQVNIEKLRGYVEVTAKKPDGTPNPEGRNLDLDARGRRFLGDTVLMKTPRANRERLDRIEQHKLDRQVGASLRGIAGTSAAQRLRMAGGRVPEADDPLLADLIQRAPAHGIPAHALKALYAESVADSILHKQVRSGAIGGHQYGQE